MVSQFNATEVLREQNGSNTRFSMLDLPFGIFFLSIIFAVAGAIVLVPICMLALGSFIMYKNIGELRNSVVKRTEKADAKSSFIYEVLSNISFVKMEAFESSIMRRYSSLLNNASKYNFDASNSNNKIMGLVQLLSSSVTIFIVSTGAMLVVDNQMSFGSLSACTLLGARAIQPFTSVISYYTAYINYDVQNQKIEKLMHLPEPKFSAIANSDEEDKKEIAGLISVKKVDFFGEGSAIRNLSMDIMPGTMIGIKGMGYTAPSELLKIIGGISYPDGGKVFIDNVNVESEEFYNLAEQVAYVPPITSLVKGSILDNLTMFRKGPIIEKAVEAAKLTGLESAMFKINKGYDSQINTAIFPGLPPSISQLLGVTRALVMRPKILLFDNSVTFFDHKMNRSFIELLAGLKSISSVLLVSDRPSLLNMADHILSYNNGQFNGLTRNGIFDASAKADEILFSDYLTSEAKEIEPEVKEKLRTSLAG